MFTPAGFGGNEFPDHSRSCEMGYTTAGFRAKYGVTSYGPYYPWQALQAMCFWE